MRRLSALVLAALCAAPAWAIKPPPNARQDARRYRKATAPKPPEPGRAAEESLRRFSEFNRANGGGWKIRFDPETGLPEALVEGSARPQGGLAPAAFGAGVGAGAAAESIAAAFLSQQRDLLGIDPADLVLEKKVTGEGGVVHLLYRQTHRGLPVEASRVKIHVGPDGAVLGANSRYHPVSDTDLTPRVPEPAAADAVLRDSGVPPRGGALVLFPDEKGVPRLAWKFTARSRSALWRYFVDAKTGDILFRYNDMRYQACNTQGTVMGMVYDIDPSTTPGPVARPFLHQKVWVGSGSTYTVSGSDLIQGGGFFCHSQPGKVIAGLQGPYVNVANFRGHSAHFDNGGGVWSTRATPVSSPHPYPNNYDSTQTVDLSIAVPNAVKVLPVFSAFDVGQFETGLEVSDNDVVEVLDSENKAVGRYVGSRGSFRGAAAHGTQMKLRLRSNAAGQQYGYDVSVSSYLTLPVPGVPAVPHSSFTWTPAMTALNLRSELNLFYHLNKMHDYFVGSVDPTSAAYVGGNVLAMAFVGPDLNNAYYDPEYDGLYFGDLSAISPSDILTDDATVPRHEYAHYMLEKVFSLQNYGQAGAISEAMADYFAASSLDYSTIGRYYATGTGAGPFLRELDCVGTSEPCWKLVQSIQAGNERTWAGEIHEDSFFLGQALWDIRRDRIVALGYTNGKKCADRLLFQGLLFFPESFMELYDSMKRVDRAGMVAACGGANTAQAIINTAFANHGLIAPSSDAFEGDRSNNGFETAVDITTYTTLSATISPQADFDFFSFAAGPGPVLVTLRLPVDGPFYKGYDLTLYDAQHRVVARAAPSYDGVNTFGGFCEATDCTTSQPTVTLSYQVATPGLYFLQVAGGQSVSGSNSGVNSTVPYTLEVVYPKAGALTGGVVSASYDRDVIGFSVNVSSFVRTQNYSFAHAQLRDHSKRVLENTDTRGTGAFLTMLSSTNALGKVSGTLRLNAGFGARFPAVGTVHLEVFAYNVDTDTVRVSTISLGLSNPLNLTADKSELKAYNNVFNPMLGQKTAIKYEIQSPGHLTLKLYSLSGALISTILDADVPAGKGSLDWDGSNTAGSVVASGIYILQAQGPGLNKRQKIVVVK